MKRHGLSEPECPRPFLGSCDKCPASSKNGGDCHGWKAEVKQ